MKTLSFTNCFALAVVLTASCAYAQSNGVPGPQDYDKFSRFIADRNIFDPNRQPHYYNGHSTYHPRTTRSRGIPGIQLVGTMSYEKGMFAFFSGNNEDLNAVEQTGGKIQGYTITQITPDSVSLQAADEKEPHKLKIGDGLRQENGKWIFADASDLPSMDTASSTAESSNSSSNTGSATTTSTPSTPPSASEQNDTLKRLMQQREKENQ